MESKLLRETKQTSVDHLLHTDILCDSLTTLPDSYYSYFIKILLFSPALIASRQKSKHCLTAKPVLFPSTTPDS